MALSITSAYIGEALVTLYKVLFTGNQVVEKGAACLVTGIAKKKYLKKLSQTANPIGAYTTGTPGSDTVTTTYAERYLEPQKMTVYETFTPDDMLGLWPEDQPVGDLTNLAAQPAFLTAMLDLYKNNYETQISKLYWQGSTTGGDAFNGIYTRALADGSVINPTAAGNITTANVVEILYSVWAAIPDKLMDDPDMLIFMSTTDYKKLQQANLLAKQSSTGVLNQTVQNLFFSNRIVHFSDFPANYIMAAKATADEATSNLFMGAYVNPDEEEPVIAKTAPHAKTWAMRVDFAVDANYREASEIVMYEPA